MRLYKKAAACLLTAAMAISMLTACGGGGTGGNGGGNTPTLPNPGEIVLPGEGGGEGGGEGTETKPTKTPIAVNSSKLAKFNKNYAGATEFYVEMQVVNYDKDGSAMLSTDARLALKGHKAYMNMTMSGKNQKQRSAEQLILKEDKLYNTYLLLRDSKVAVKTDSDSAGDGDDPIESLDSLIAYKLPSQMWSAKMKVGPNEYDAEVFILDSYEYTVCYTTDGNPVYKFVRDPSAKQIRTAFLYKTIQAGSGTSKGLCEMPAGTKIYSFDDEDDNYTLTDANGNVFTLEPVTNSNGDMTGFIFRDKDGKDVSDDFKWANDFYKSMSGQ